MTDQNPWGFTRTADIWAKTTLVFHETFNPYAAFQTEGHLRRTSEGHFYLEQGKTEDVTQDMQDAEDRVAEARWDLIRNGFNND